MSYVMSHELEEYISHQKKLIVSNNQADFRPTSQEEIDAMIERAILRYKLGKEYLEFYNEREKKVSAWLWYFKYPRESPYLLVEIYSPGFGSVLVPGRFSMVRKARELLTKLG